jgi:hypothetical protein
MILWLASVAFAGSVYVNGVQVDGLRNQSFQGCEVTIDAEGNIHVTAPGYHIEVVGGSEKKKRSSAPAAAAPPVAAFEPGLDLSDGGAVAAPSGPTTSTLRGGLVPQGAWWLLAEDLGGGHQVAVYVNGAKVLGMSSGAGSAIRDLGGYLRPGENTVRVDATSASSASGSLGVYVATGEDRSGAVVLASPRVRFSTSGDQGAVSREYTLVVQ